MKDYLEIAIFSCGTLTIQIISTIHQKQDQIPAEVLPNQRYRIFFFYPEMFKIWNFLWKNEWLSENTVFFSGAAFFSALWNRVSEWRVDFCCDKKKRFFPRFLAKKTTKKQKIDKKCHFLRVFTFFWRSTFAQLSEWLANFSWKKKTARFFSKNPEKKKNTLSEAEKNIRYLWPIASEELLLYTVSPVRWDTYFQVNRVENQKLNQTTAELPFGWVFGFQLGLRQTQ